MSDAGSGGFDAVDQGPRPSDVVGEGQEASSAAVADHPTVEALQAEFPGAVLRHEVCAGDEHVVFVDPDRNLEILRWLHDDADQAYDHLADVTAVDYGGGRPLQVVYQLWSIPNRQALRVKCELPLDGLEIESSTAIWRGANWLEREVYDLFGITFRGHPDLRRILMPEDYEEGHPLRKDFPLRGRFSREEQTRRALSQEPEHYYFPGEMGGREPQLVEASPAEPEDMSGSESSAD